MREGFACEASQRALFHSISESVEKVPIFKKISKEKVVYLCVGLMLKQIIIGDATTALGKEQVIKGFIVESPLRSFLDRKLEWGENPFMFSVTMDKLDEVLNRRSVDRCYVHLVRKSGGVIKKEKTFLRMKPGKYIFTWQRN